MAVSAMAMMEVKRAQEIIKNLQWWKHTEKESFVWQSQSTYAEHLAIDTAIVFWYWGHLLTGGTLSPVEDVVDWSVDHCDFSVISWLCNIPWLFLF